MIAERHDQRHEGGSALPEAGLGRGGLDPGGQWSRNPRPEHGARALSGDQQEQRQQLYTILDGYETFCEFDERQLGFIEPLRTLRMLNYLVWLHQRWDDPAFPQAFPWFNQQECWQNQYRILQEQAQLLERPSNITNYNC